MSARFRDVLLVAVVVAASLATVPASAQGNNNAPVLTSPLTAFIPEGTTAVQTVTATDADGDTVTFAITGRAERERFEINAASGELRFKEAPDFENPGDFNRNNRYTVEVTASDSALTVSHPVTVDVYDVDDNSPVVTLVAEASVPEGTTAVQTVTATDANGDAVTFTVSGGADEALFEIDAATGELRFKTAPDFEAPGSATGSNVYLVEVTASDGTSAPWQLITVTVTDVNEGTLVVTSAATASVPEGTTAVQTVTATDANGDAVTFTVSGGADEERFEIDAAGALAFKAAPDFEAPGSAAGNNVYLVEVTATDGTSAVPQSITVTVTNVNDAPVVTSEASANVAEGTTTVLTVAASDADANSGPVTFTVSGGADEALFEIDAASGALAFKAAPDFEAPGSAAGSNVYLVEVTATNSASSTPQSITVTVTNVNDPVAACVEGAVSDHGFTDVSKSSFVSDIGCIKTLGVTRGTSATTYSPQDLVTREQVAAFLARLYSKVTGKECAATDHGFTDVPQSSYANGDIGCIKTLGVTRGTSATTYSPQDLVTREQMAAFLARLYSKVTGKECAATDHGFTDVSGSRFVSDIGCIKNLGVTTGTPTATTYSPKGSVTREQMAAFLARMYRNLV